MLMRLIRRIFRRDPRAGQAAAVEPVTQVSALLDAVDQGAPARTGSVAPPHEVIAHDAMTHDAMPHGTSASHESAPPLSVRVAVPDPLPDAVADTVPVAAQLRQRVSSACAVVAAELPLGTEGGDMRRLLEAVAGEPATVIRQLPSAAQDALALCNGGTVTATELTALVERDPMLTQALLQTANSAWYQRGGQAPVVSIRAAIERIGVSGLRTVLLKVTVSGLLCRPGGAFGPMVMQVWEHMVRTAPIARRVARAYPVVADTAFSLGLLHDVGKLVIFDQVATLRTELRRDFRADPDQVRHLLRHLHEPLGGTAAIEWGLGDEAALAIASHHRSPVPLVDSPFSEILHLAERADLADVRDIPFDMEAIWRDGAISASGPRIMDLLLEEQQAGAVADA